MTWLAVALGGGLGAIARFVTDAGIKARAPRSWPLGTFAINVVGSCVLGLVSGLAMPSVWAPLLTTGFCGGFTTFSTASVETLTLLRARRGRTAGVYAASTLVSCVGACALGMALARLA